MVDHRYKIKDKSHISNSTFLLKNHEMLLSGFHRHTQHAAEIMNPVFIGYLNSLQMNLFRKRYLRDANSLTEKKLGDYLPK